MASLMPDVNGLDVLDLGCGAGDLSRKVKSLGARYVIGIDVSRNMLRLAQANVPVGVRFLNQSIEDADFEAASFDLIRAL